MNKINEFLIPGEYYWVKRPKMDNFEIGICFDLNKNGRCIKFMDGQYISDISFEKCSFLFPGISKPLAYIDY